MRELARRVGSPIGVRRFVTTNGEDVYVAIGPAVADGPGFEARYLVLGGGHDIFGSAPGVDELQAVLMAFVCLRDVLEPHREKLRWLGPEPEGILGFPQVVPEDYGRAFNARIRRLCVKESYAHADRAIAARRRKKKADARAKKRT